MHYLCKNFSEPMQKNATTLVSQYWPLDMKTFSISIAQMKMFFTERLRSWLIIKPQTNLCPVHYKNCFEAVPHHVVLTS